MNEQFFNVLKDSNAIEELIELIEGIQLPTTLEFSVEVQSGNPGENLAPLVVKVTDQNGDLVAGVSVSFSITSGEGTLSTDTATTEADGLAETTLTLGMSIGATVVEASVEGISEKAIFIAIINPIPPTTPSLSLTIVGENLRSGNPGKRLEPFVVEVKDQNGQAVDGVNVTFSITYGEGTLSTEKTDTVKGLAETTLTLGSSIGTTVVEASVEEISEKPIFIATTNPLTLEMYSGNGQNGNPNEDLTDPLVVIVKDQNGDPVPNVSVTFKTWGNAYLLPTTISTDTDGLAQTILTLGTIIGTTLVEASVEGTSEKVTFIAITTPIPPPTQSLTIVGENSQSGDPGESLEPFVVQVTDQNGDPVPGVNVTFSITHGEGTLSDDAPTTGGNGQAETTLTLGTIIGATLVEASVKGTSEKVTFIAITTPILPPTQSLTIVGENSQSGNPGESLEPFVVQVTDQNGDPVPGVNVTFSITHGEGTLSDDAPTTGGNGQAETTLTLGTIIGATLVEASVKGTSEKVTFIAITTPILPPTQSLTIVGENSQSGNPGESLEPFVVQVTDQNGDPVPGVNVTFSITHGEGTLSDDAPTTGGNGQAETTLTLGTIIGATLVEASVEGISEKATFIAFTHPITPPTRSLTIVSGNGQSGAPNDTLPNQLEVKVTDQDGVAVPSKNVTFRIMHGEGTLSPGTALTDGNGQAQTTLTLGPNPGTILVEASIAESPEKPTFIATAIPLTLEMVEGNGQSGVPDTLLQNPLAVKVTDQDGVAVRSQNVAFRIVWGDGSLSVQTVLTNAEGKAEARLTLGPNPGPTLVEASVEGSSEKVIFIATTNPITPTSLMLAVVGENSQSGDPGESLEPFVVQVTDQNGDPVPGVNVTFSITFGEGTLSLETVTTEADGLAETTLTLGQAGSTVVVASIDDSSDQAIFIANTTPITSLPDTDTPIPPELSVSITPSKIVSPEPDEHIVFLVRIAGGESITGYEITVEYDGDALEYLKQDGTQPQFNCNYLPYAVEVSEIVSVESNPDTVTLKAVSPYYIGNSGDGILAKLIFIVKEKRASTLTLAKVNLTDSNDNLLLIEGDQLKKSEILYGVDVNGDGKIDEMDMNVVAENIGLSGNSGDVNGDTVVDIRDIVLVAQLLDSASVLYGTAIKELCPLDDLPEDLNGDGVVNILDLVLMANAFGETSSAPAAASLAQAGISATDVQTWLTQAKASDPNIPESIRRHPDYQRGIAVLENLLSTLTQTTAAPKKTALLLNYPNPFNPETWIPYQLAEATDVTLTIHSLNGTLVRTLSLGHKTAGLYRSKSRAAYWDGKNEFGERVASGLYFYTLTAGKFSATGKMLIRK